MLKLRRAASSLGAALVAAALTLPACADPLAAFVTLGGADGGEPFALARVIVPGAGAHCPALAPIGGGAEQPMTSRRNPDPTHFDVTVCEAVYPTDGTRLKVSGLKVGGADLQLPGVQAEVSRMVIFGDTGCHPKYQDRCRAGKHWPFGELARAAAESGPQLVVHVGDYNYRGTPGKIDIRHPDGALHRGRVYDAGDNAPGVTCTLSGPYTGQNSAGSTSPDAWKPWQEDFFEPARSLLHAAPWVFARGNHELCSRAGPGYFYLLDPGSDLVPASGGQLACTSAAAAEPLVFREPFRLDLGNLSLVVLDSANACDQGDLHQAHFDAQFRKIRRLMQDAPATGPAWLLTHRPIWGLTEPDDGAPGQTRDATGHYEVIDRTLQTAYARAPWPKPIELVLSGHVHRFQSVASEPPGALPLQLIIGNSGTELSRSYDGATFLVPLGETTAVCFGLSEFGYMDIAFQGGAWTGRLFERAGKVSVRCATEAPAKTAVCAFAE